MSDPFFLPSDGPSCPAALRNREPIRDVLRGLLPRRGTALELGAGTGEHAVFLAASFPDLVWQPTDPDPHAIDSINRHAAVAALPNLRMPFRLDARDEDWPHAQVDAVLAINIVHIAPWAVAEGILAGAARGLSVGGMLYLYGPYKVGGRHTAPSNEAFDESLRGRDPAWGVRDIDEVEAAATARGLQLTRTEPMPANNLSLVFRPTLQRGRIRGPRRVPPPDL